MTDYIGRYVKQFESGSLGSMALSSCGYDWGLSCGSYQLTLRWGNCINFLKRYFPAESTGLYFNNKGDKASKTWPGSDYCSSPDAVKSVWQKCYNKVGAEKFFEYEHAYIEASYYTPLKTKVKSILNLDDTDRAFQECFWSWAVHRGSGGAYNELKNIMSTNNITSLDYVDKEEFFDLIYDYRYAYSKTNRYKKGLMNGSSEREILRPLLTGGTFSGKENPEDPAGEEETTMGSFTPRLTEPSTTDKHWIHTSKGGLNECILISGNSCLPNCVGYAWGRFYEIVGKRPTLSRANAENWYGTSDGYARSATPALGAVACWAKGKVGVGSDGAGHVAIVEEIKPNGDIVTSNSGYSSKRFWTQIFTKASGYAMNGYTFQGFIIPPGASSVTTDSTPTQKVNALNGTFKVILRNDVLNVRTGPSMDSAVVTIYKYGQTGTVIGISEDKAWYKLGNGYFISSNTSYVQFTPVSTTSTNVNYMVRVANGTTEIKKDASKSSATVGKITTTGVYTIVQEKNGFGKLKSGAGWLNLSDPTITKL